MLTEVSEEEMNSLTQSILVRYGIDFTCYEPKSLRRRIQRVLNLYELSSIHELWVKFLRDQNFIHSFMNEVSVGMTSMFRDPQLWIRLKSRLATESNNFNRLSIWHAGCSTGEEVYSMGILLREIKLDNKVEALATDINLRAMDEAKAGMYHKLKMVENEVNYRNFNPHNSFSKYYETDGLYGLMDKSLISHAHFQYHNLITDNFPDDQDIVFCRNVMIYFDNQAKLKIMKNFAKAIKPNGYLIIGFFDTMSHLIDNDKFELIDDQAKIFRRR